MGQPSRRNDLDTLNGLRGYAALLVVFVHAGGPSLVGAPAFLGQFLEGCAYIGLGIFFVLSGFIMVAMYGARTPVDRRRFYVARLARVYPMHLVGLLLTLPFAVRLALKTDGWAELARHLFFSLTLLLAWSPDLGGVLNFPAWSLGVEAFFYLLFPFLIGPVLRLPTRAVLPTAAAVWLAFLALPVLYLLLAPDGRTDVGPEDALTWLNVLKWNPIVHLPEFLVGMLFARLYAAGVRVPALVGDVLVVAFFVLAWAARNWPYPLVDAGLLTPFFAYRTLALVGGRGWLVRLHASRPLVRLGEASYSLYVLHVPLWLIVQSVNGVFPRLAPSVLFWPYLVLLVTVSLLAQRFVEEPARRWVSRVLSGNRSGAVGSRPSP